MNREPRNMFDEKPNPTVGFDCVFCGINFGSFPQMLEHTQKECDKMKTGVAHLYKRVMTPIFFGQFSKMLSSIRPDIKLDQVAQHTITRGSKARERTKPITQVDLRCLRNENLPGCRCYVCEKTLPPSAVRVQNAELEPEEHITVCVDCFVRGAEKPPHRCFHEYRVLNRVTDTLFDPDWTADEELLLLDAVFTYGLGNWQRVAEHVQTKEKPECSIHYIQLYCQAKKNNTDTILPTPISDIENISEIFPLKEVKKPKPYENSHDPFIHPNVCAKAARLGLNEKRREFELEWNNPAEKVLSGTEFSKQDTKEQVLLKLQCCHLYNDKIHGRDERREFLLQRGIDFGSKVRDRKSFRALHNAYSRLARFGSPNEHRQFLQSLAKEEELREEIYRLQMFRLNGFKTMREVDDYEKHTKKQKQKLRQFPLSSTYSASPPPSLSQGTSTRKRKGVHLVREDEAQTIKRPKTMDEEEDFEELTETEQKLASGLHLPPKTLNKIKDNVSQQLYTYGLMNPGQAGTQFLKYQVDENGKMRTTYSWSRRLELPLQPISAASVSDK